MKTKKFLISTAFAFTLFLIFISTYASATSSQNASSATSYTYVSNAGNNTVSVIDTSTNTVIATVPVLPVANFSTDITSGYSPLTVQFTDLSENATAWNWDFGDGTTSTEQNPVHTFYSYCSDHFSCPPDYPSGCLVTLTAINRNGSSYKSEQITTLSYPPESEPLFASFLSFPDENDPLSVQFQDYSVYGLGAWYNWDFGDGTSSTEQNPFHTYPSAGDYTVTLILTGEWAQSTTSQVVSVKDLTAPVADFSASPSSGIEPLKVSFTDMSTGGPRSWYWDFGDGANSTEQNPIHTYSSAGNYSVNLTAANIKGEDSRLTAINVSEQKVLPVANFSSRATFGYAPFPVQFTDLSENATVWNWDFGDGTNSTEQNPTHTYYTAGNYTVSLKVRNARGMDSRTSRINVLPNSLNMVKYVYITNSNSNTVSIIDTITNEVIDTVPVGSNPYGVAINPTGTKVYVTQMSSNNVYVIDAAAKTVTSILVGYDPQGVAVSPDGEKVYVTNNGNYISVIDTATNNVTAIEGAENFPEGLAVSPDGKKVYVANSNTVSVIDTATKKVIASVYVGNHPYRVAVCPDGKKVYVSNFGSDTVSVIDTATNNVTATVDVGNCPEGLAVSPDGKKVYVTNAYSNTVSIIDTAKNNVTATVNVGDFPSDVAVSPDGKKVYVTNANSNTVSIIDTANNNIVATVPVGDHPLACGQFIVPHSALEPELPVTNFSTHATSVYSPLTVQFTDLSENATGRNWDFGDGTTSTEQNPIHTYPSAGNYKVTLQVSGEWVGETSEVVSVQGSNASVANFSASPVCGKAPLTVKFTDKSTGSPVAWKWCFGDGTSSKEKDPVHTYCKAGEYNVTLIANNTVGSNAVTKSEYIRVLK